MSLRRTLWTFLTALAALTAHPAIARERDGWTAAWATAQMVPVNDQVVPAEWLDGATVRQVVRVGLAGKEVRVRLTNAFGTAPLALRAVTLARPLANSRAVAGCPVSAASAATKIHQVRRNVIARSLGDNLAENGATFNPG